MITMMITKDDDKGDDKKLKDQSKINQRITQVNQEQFKSTQVYQSILIRTSIGT